jgi:hypothetical protein
MASFGKQAVKEVLEELKHDRNICTMLKFGPKHESYAKDRYEDVIQSVDWNACVETGENYERLHCHIWLTVHHYSQVQVNMPVLQTMFKKLYNERIGESVFRASLVCNRRPYCQVKLLPSSDWAMVMKQYIHKAMAVNSE